MELPVQDQGTCHCPVRQGLCMAVLRDLMQDLQAATCIVDLVDLTFFAVTLPWLRFHDHHCLRCVFLMSQNWPCLQSRQFQMLAGTGSVQCWTCRGADSSTRFMQWPACCWQDGNPASWSTQELSDILAVWRGVTEDYAPFDVDVTTEDPGGKYLASNGMRVVIGGSSFNRECTTFSLSFSSPLLQNREVTAKGNRKG